MSKPLASPPKSSSTTWGPRKKAVSWLSPDICLPLPFLNCWTQRKFISLHFNKCSQVPENTLPAMLTHQWTITPHQSFQREKPNWENTVGVIYLILMGSSHPLSSLGLESWAAVGAAQNGKGSPSSILYMVQIIWLLGFWGCVFRKAFHAVFWCMSLHVAVATYGSELPHLCSY